MKLLDILYEAGFTRTPEENANILKKILKLTPKFKNPRQFSLEYPTYYNFLRKNGLMDKAFPKRQKYNPDGYWDFDTISKAAEDYVSSGDFYNGNQLAYKKAKELGILKDLFPERKKGHRKYTIDQAKELAQNYTGGYSKFLVDYPGACRVLSDNDLLGRYFPNIKRGRKKLDFTNYTTDELIKYVQDRLPTNKSIINNIPQLKDELINRGVDIRKKFGYTPKYEIYAGMSNDELIKTAQTYGSREILASKNLTLYKELINRNISKIVFPNNPIKSKYSDMSDTELINLAQPYGNTNNLHISNSQLSNELKSRGLTTHLFKYKHYSAEVPNEPLTGQGVYKRYPELDDNRKYDDGVMFTPVSEQISNIKRILR
jgi:hypothetical protein